MTCFKCIKFMTKVIWLLKLQVYYKPSKYRNFKEYAYFVDLAKGLYSQESPSVYDIRFLKKCYNSCWPTGRENI